MPYNSWDYRDGLANITERHPDLNVNDETPAQHPQLQVTDKPGVEVVLDLIKSEPERSITYVALGPLTNLAKAMRLDRSVVNERIGRIVCMGGALDVPGNTSPVAECTYLTLLYLPHGLTRPRVSVNFFADPYAVQELLCSSEPDQGLPLDRFLLLPLDITTPHELSFPLYAEKIDPTFSTSARPSQPAGKPPLVHFTSAFLERTREVMCEFGKDALELHDIAAVWCALANPAAAAQGQGEPQLGAPAPLQDGWKAIRRKFAVERCVSRIHF